MRRPLLSLVMAGVVTASVAAVGLLATPAVSTAKAARPLYISMGDSYSVGYQNPTLGNTKGFTAYVAMKEKLQLENFGCGGATTSSLFTQIGCPPGASAATDAVAYPSTDQVDAVLSYIAQPANFGKVQLVTVSISGNDVTACANNANPIPCVQAAQATIETNVGNLVSELDAALTANGDTTAHIVGITYPDVILGDYVMPVGATNPVLAALSKLAFDALINPALNTEYMSVARGGFVNVTSAPYGKAIAGDDTGAFDLTTGAYTGPMSKLTGFGMVPAPVAEICTLTWYCNASTFGDIHANSKGYHFIGKLIVTEISKL
ncbi:MAG TPA: SGNH/GDSL hydrolase family protein [Acidimicrobiales bacterium]